MRVAAWAVVGIGLALGSQGLAFPVDAAADDGVQATFWAFRAPTRTVAPPLQQGGWSRQPLDEFVLARLEAAGLNPAPEADRRTWVRRVTYDLTGLPPTPRTIRAFLLDKAPGARERVVDRLLSSEQFGERWASLWLNLARYAEDQAHQVGNDEKHFYPNAYRYRDWVIEALNEDIPYDRFVKLQLAADLLEETGENRDTGEHLAALGFLGLGPKYYGRGSVQVMAHEWEDRVDTVCRTFLGLTVACARCHDHKFDPIGMDDYYALAGIFASTKMVNRSAVTPVDGKESEKKPPNNRPPPDTLHVVEDMKPRDLNIFRRGNADNKGPVVQRRFLSVLCDGEPPHFLRGSGRLDLAEAIVDRGNPLTARVFVNRVWLQLFGQPLVMTPSNFGSLGDRPSHPKLLDDLAARFMDSGWSLKGLLREVLLSATYGQSSRGDSECVEKDPDNRLLWRMNRKRLDIEAWRDTLLAVSGVLDDSVGGVSHDPADESGRRRTVYSRISRLQLNSLLRLFDYPDPNVHSSKRAVTTTPMQKLFVLNSPFLVARAKDLAARLELENRDGDVRIERAYGLLYGREPTPEEKKIAEAFLSGKDGKGMTRWQQYAQVLLASNELLFVD